ncbi:MAG: N-6 DNA methylase, partial [Synergistales bacterium]|nr:N-6 DNA methylase [Synergistales bacterium]
MGAAVQALVGKLADFEPTTPTLRPEESRDLLKKLYQYLVPKKLRHDLGEYYTPDWLAERLLNQLGYNGDPNVRLLDPACGSGTFLTLALARVREKMGFEMWDRDPKRRRECAGKVLRNIVGFDLNPLAVIAARTNYLLAFGDLLRDVRPVEIPVYNCDSVLTPVLQKQAQMEKQNLFAPDQPYFFLPTVEGEFRLPKTVLDQKALSTVTAALEECIAVGYAPEEFLARIERELKLNGGARDILGELYVKIEELERQGKNGVWVRLLKNSFAPVLQEPFDLVVGNPPWVNWEHLPESWRELSKELWTHYGLFSLKGYAQLLGGAKPDISMLFTYTCADHYLKPKGRLGFVITQTVFKTKGAGEGFRRFRLGEKGVPLCVKTVDDLSDLQPFEGATNRTAILTLIKGETTHYPIPYTVWKRKQGQRIALESTLQEASKKSRRFDHWAEPVDPKNPSSPWITANRYVLSALRKVVGKSPYRAYAGACTWLNGVYWVQILERRTDGLAVIENLGNVGRKKMPIVRAAVEPDLLYPLLRGRDIGPWQANPKIFLLLSQDCMQGMGGYPEGVMKINFPGAYIYLKQFEKELRQRSGFKQYFNPDKDPFWSLYNVGSYTLAPYKVVWREQASQLTCAVTSTAAFFGNIRKVIIPDHKVLFIPFEYEKEAHFVAALLGSRIAQLIVKSYALETSISTHIMEFIRVPKFEPGQIIHCELAA